jgi:hypothetical protein
LNNQTIPQALQQFNSEIFKVPNVTAAPMIIDTFHGRFQPCPARFKGWDLKVDPVCVSAKQNDPLARRIAFFQYMPNWGEQQPNLTHRRYVMVIDYGNKLRQPSMSLSDYTKWCDFGPKEAKQYKQDLDRLTAAILTVGPSLIKTAEDHHLKRLQKQKVVELQAERDRQRAQRNKAVQAAVEECKRRGGSYSTISGCRISKGPKGPSIAFWGTTIALGGAAFLGTYWYRTRTGPFSR